MIINRREQSIVLHSAEQSKIGDARKEGQGRGHRGKPSGKRSVIKERKLNSNRAQEEGKQREGQTYEWFYDVKRKHQPRLIKIKSSSKLNFQLSFEGKIFSLFTIRFAVLSMWLMFGFKNSIFVTQLKLHMSGQMFNVTLNKYILT